MENSRLRTLVVFLTVIGCAALLLQFYPDAPSLPFRPEIRTGGKIVDTVRLGEYYMDPGGEVVLNGRCIAAKASGRVNSDAVGVYLIDYDYTDTSGVQATTVTRTVHVIPKKLLPQVRDSILERY